MKEIVMLVMSVKMVLIVDQTIVQNHLVLAPKLIAVALLLKLGVPIIQIHTQIMQKRNGS